ncbi:MAG: hypothetical protein ABSD80_00775 [Caulobacteraceae bacterium]|jgi:hypothetical protein
MRAWRVVLALIAMPAAAIAAPKLEVRAAAAHITIITEARTDIRVTVIHKRLNLPLRVFQSGDLTVIDGRLGHRVRGCPRLPDGLGVHVRGLGDVAAAALPIVVVRMPADASVLVGDAVSGEIGRTTRLDFENRGCGDWTIADVAGPVRLGQIGAGALRAARVGAATLNVADGGSIATGPVAGGVTAVSSGDGVISVLTANGAVVARVAGSGGVNIAGGRAPQLSASVAGSGAIRFGGEAGRVTAEVEGPGVVSVAQATGPVSRRVFGAGQIHLGP